MKKQIIWLVIILVVVGVAYWWWGGSKKELSGESIKIGVALSLTGKAASFGERLKNGIDLAVEELNKKDIKVEVLYEDTLSEVDSAVSAVKKLIDIEGVKVIIGPVRSNDVLAVAPVTEEKKIILFTPIASAEEISQAGDYVFRNRESTMAHGLGMADFLIKSDIKKAGVLAAKSANSLSYAKFFKEEFEKLGGEIVFNVEYEENTTDFRTELIKVQKSGAQALYLAVATGKDAGILAKQIKELKINLLATGSAAFDSQEFITGAGEAADLVTFSSASFNTNDPKVAAFNEFYRARYGKDGDGFVANAYDAMMLIVEAINECERDDTDCIRDYLYGVKDYAGIGGLTTFDENGDVSKPIMLKTVRNGQFVKYEK